MTKITSVKDGPYKIDGPVIAEKDLEIKFLTDSIQLIKFAKDNKLKLVAIEQSKNSVALNNWQPQKNSVLVFGNELQGYSLFPLRLNVTAVCFRRRVYLNKFTNSNPSPTPKKTSVRS